MPFILVVLFVIALVVTFTGLFLSPPAQSRNSNDGYLVTPKGRKIVEARPVQTKNKQRADDTVSMPAWQQRSVSEPPRQHILRGRRFVDPPTPYIPPRASRGNIASSITSSTIAQPSVIEVPGIKRIPATWQDLTDRLGSWKIVLPGLCALFLLFFYLFSLLFPQQITWTSAWFGNPNQPQVTPTESGLPAGYDASKVLIRLNQLDPAQYASSQEFNTWAYSACSAASMTEVINSYGHNYHITTILEVESKIHEITPSEGLLEESGIADTGDQFSFKTTWGHNLSLDQIIAIANGGAPVIVSFPPDRYPGGHILVVRGGDKNTVDLADSSLYNRTGVSRSFFLQYWEGFYAVMKPA